MVGKRFADEEKILFIIQQCHFFDEVIGYWYFFFAAGRGFSGDERMFVCANLRCVIIKKEAKFFGKTQAGR